MRLIVAFLLPAISGFAADWPRFRGPNGSGIAGAGSLPAEFGSKKHLIWKVKAPAGTSSPTGAEAGGPFSLLASFDKNKDGKLAKEEIQDPGMIRLLMGIEKEYGDNDGQLDEKEWDKFREAAKDIGGMTAIKLNGHGDLSKTGIRWRLLKSIPYLTSSLLFEGVLYSIRDGGILSSINPDTGVIHKQGRLEGAMDKYYASPVAGDGKLYLTSEQGKIAVVKAGPQWDLLAVNDLEEQTYATPALANGRIYIRTRPSLYCFGLTATLGQ
jgi:hypothetical protein